MSKRLRASMRAANKGRNLRPRASQSHPPEGRTSQAPAESLADLAKAQVPEIEARTSEAPPSVPPAAADETPAPREAEPVEAAKAPAEKVVAAAEPPVETPAKPVEEAPAQSEKVAETKAEPSIPSPSVPARAPEAPVTMGETPKPPARPEPEPEPAVAAKAESPKAESPKAGTTDLAKTAASRVEPAKSSVPPPKVEESKKPVQKASAQPEASARPAGKDGGKDAKKATKIEEPKAAPASKKAEAAPASKKPAPAHDHGHDEDLDPSSISAAFFRKDQDSVPPVEEHDDEDLAPPQIVLSPETLARRAQLRRVVAGVVAFAGVVSIAVVGKVLATKHQPPMPAVAVETKRDVPQAGEVKPAADAKLAAAEVKAPDKIEDKKADQAAKADAPKADAPKADEAKKDEAKPEDAKKDDAKGADAKKDDAKKDDAKKDEAKPAASGADADALKKETLSLLNRGKNKDAIEKAKEAIAADPTDATVYLYLGSALQDTGKWKEGIEAYCDCVRNATKGPVNECRAMGGHK